MQVLCSQCGAAMVCEPGGACWCTELPHLLPVPKPGMEGCLCRTCLASELEQGSADSDRREGEPEMTKETGCV